MYEYRARVIRNVDGDTVHVRVDLGCDIRVDLSLRFAGVNTPELPTPEGVAAAEFTAGKIPPGAVFTLRTVRDRKERYGRYLAYLLLDDGTCLNRTLVDSGMAVPLGPFPVEPPS